MTYNPNVRQLTPEEQYNLLTNSINAEIDAVSIELYGCPYQSLSYAGQQEYVMAEWSRRYEVGR